MASVKDLLEAVDNFDWDAYNAELRPDFTDVFGNIVQVQGERANTVAGGDGFHNDDPFVQKRLTNYIGDRIEQLDETTKEDVKDLIRNVLDAAEDSTVGELGDKIAELVQEKFDGYADWRADRIARTETAIAYNYGNVFGYRQAGVEKVEVSDGDDDEECAAADGQIWTLEEALAKPLAHPNCERDFSPVLEEE